MIGSENIVLQSASGGYSLPRTAHHTQLVFDDMSHSPHSPETTGQSQSHLLGGMKEYDLVILTLYK